MLRKILSVSGFTLLSRVTGFLRDVVMAAVMGSGLLTDAFVVASKLPNHFRAIFGEGALNNVMVPAYARVHERSGQDAARLFADRLLSIMLVVQLLGLALAWSFMPQLVSLLAPGFEEFPEKYQLAISLTRITFPYLLLITLVTFISGQLNAVDRFAAAAAAPVLLNLAMLAALGVAFLFPNAAYAVAWGMAVSGLLQLILVAGDAYRAGIGPRLRLPKWDADTARFFRVLGPAIIGSAGVQIAMFADTIIASTLPTGAVSSIYFADRLYQLPLGVIAIAVGTVVLPEMSRKLALNDTAGAHGAQNKAIALTLLAAAPFFAAFLLVPTLIMQALFGRGAFTAEDAAASGAVLAAYAVGLPAIVLIRSAVASFYARQDSKTPLIASLTAVGVNVLLKILLTKTWGAPGLALATAIGAWVNVILLFILAHRRAWMGTTPLFLKTLGCIALATLALTATTLALLPLTRDWVSTLPMWRAEAQIAILASAAIVTYIAVAAASLKLTGAGTRGLR